MQRVLAARFIHTVFFYLHPLMDKMRFVLGVPSGLGLLKAEQSQAG